MEISTFDQAILPALLDRVRELVGAGESDFCLCELASPDPKPDGALDPEICTN